MNKYTEKQTELLCLLNDNQVPPNNDFKIIADIFDIEHIKETGWWLVDEDKEILK